MPMAFAACQLAAKVGSLIVMPSVALMNANEIRPFSAAQLNDGWKLERSMPAALATAPPVLALAGGRSRRRPLMGGGQARLSSRSPLEKGALSRHGAQP